MAMPAVGARNGTPRPSRGGSRPHTVASRTEPFDSVISTHPDV